MPNFIITYDYTEQIIEEAQTTMVRFYAFHRIDRWLMPILGIIGIIAALILQDWYPLILPAGALFQLVLVYFGQKRAIQMEKERTSLINKGQTPQLSWTVDTDKGQIISFKNGQEVNTFDLADVLGLIDTSSLLIVRLKGKLFIPLPKTAFQQGSPHELLAWLTQTFPRLKIWRR